MQNGEIKDVLDYWFSDTDLDSPTLDSRMDRWFGSSEELDAEIRERFGRLVERASGDELDAWAEQPEGRLALIILLDQFRRNIYRGKPGAFELDKKALKICIEGTMSGVHKHLSPEQRVFFFMPLQHAESLKIQDKSVSIYNALAESVSDTLRETFATCAQFAELHRDIVAEFGRFPHRNEILGRENTEAEAAYLSGEVPSFGQ
ncbi:MAG: DUF924 domain-containing protein [Gammaproteobacteria bacterium]|nr:DUF924 domain-containing protein [Gammaproteobacteria bacterium]MBT8443375.1 DUF924 domain-containing protein [Gammaproteobacteria bacterium]